MFLAPKSSSHSSAGDGRPPLSRDHGASKSKPHNVDQPGDDEKTGDDNLSTGEARLHGRRRRPRPV